MYKELYLDTMTSRASLNRLARILSYDPMESPLVEQLKVIHDDGNLLILDSTDRYIASCAFPFYKGVYVKAFVDGQESTPLEFFTNLVNNF